MSDPVDPPRGVSARALRRIAFPVVLLGGLAAGLLDRSAGFMAVFVAPFPWLMYGTLLAVPIQVLYRDARLRALGVVLFAVGVVSTVAVFWSVPLHDDNVYDSSEAVVAVRELVGRGRVEDAGAAAWLDTALGLAGVAVVACLSLCVVVNRLQRISRGRAVNPVAAGAVLGTFATLPEPSGGTSVTRPAAREDRAT